MNYNYFLLSILLSFTLINSNPPLAQTEEQCKDMSKKYGCWCSVECGPRTKMTEADAAKEPANPNRPAEAEGGDNPQWDANDPHGIKCYCKPWDQQNVNRCANKLS